MQVGQVSSRASNSSSHGRIQQVRNSSFPYKGGRIAGSQRLQVSRSPRAAVGGGMAAAYTLHIAYRLGMGACREGSRLASLWLPVFHGQAAVRHLQSDLVQVPAEKAFLAAVRVQYEDPGPCFGLSEPLSSSMPCSHAAVILGLGHGQAGASETLP